jgi:hypothetical protein
MPKVKWGGDLTSDAIDSAERREGGDYAGEVPPKGIYRFKIRFSKKDKAKDSGNPKLVSLLVLDGSWKKEHKQYDGCPVWDHMPVTGKTAFRVRAYCDALNISSADFMGKMVVDDDGNVQKIGKLKIADEDLLVYVSVKPEKNTEYGDRLVLAGGYMPFREDEADDDSNDDDDDSKGTDDDETDGDGDPF